MASGQHQQQHLVVFTVFARRVYTSPGWPAGRFTRCHLGMSRVCITQGSCESQTELINSCCCCTEDVVSTLRTMYIQSAQQCSSEPRCNGIQRINYTAQHSPSVYLQPYSVHYVTFHSVSYFSLYFRFLFLFMLFRPSVFPF